MRFYACWFLADPGDASAIRSIATTKEHKLEEWPHLILPGVDSPDVNTLERLARPKGTKGRTGGTLLVRSNLTATPFTAVSLVAEWFVQRLAALDDPSLLDLARRWAGAIEGVTEEAAAGLVRDMAEFARRAEEEGKPVLQLDVM
jgi:hypothetical protein